MSKLLTEIRFYQLGQTPLAKALVGILGKALERDFHAVVLCSSSERLDDLNARLWTVEQAAFIPHGGPKDGDAEHQPVWLTTDADDNPNGAKLLVLTDGTAAPASLNHYDMCCVMIDGNDEPALKAARKQWKTFKDDDYVLSYWAQSAAGKWEQQDV